MHTDLGLVGVLLAVVTAASIAAARAIRVPSPVVHAQASARNGDAATTIHEARSSTYRDLRGLLDTLSAAAMG